MGAATGHMRGAGVAHATARRRFVDALRLLALSGAVLAFFVVPASSRAESAYVANQTSSSVSQYTIEPLIETLTPKSPAAVAAGTGTDAIAVSPDGMSVYAANDTSDSISQYTVEPVTGKLTPNTPATVSTGTGPRGLVVSPDGKSLYVVNEASSAPSRSTRSRR